MIFINKQYLINKLDEFIKQHLLAEYESKTIKDYRQAINKFIDYVNDEFVLNKEITIAYKQYLKTKYSIATINKYIIILNKFLKYIGQEECVLKKLKVQQKTSIDDPIWEQEHKRMLRWSKKLNMEDMYLIIKIFAFAGIRIDELKYFTVENIDNYI